MDWQKSQRKARAQRDKWERNLDEQRKQLINRIGSLARGSLGSDYADTLSDQLIEGQVAMGLREDNREGLSVGQKNILYEAGDKVLTGRAATQQRYSNAVWRDGRPYQKGAGGAWVDVSSHPDLTTHDDLEAFEKMERRLGKTLNTLWPQYYSQYIHDDPADVQRAVTALFQNGLTQHDLEAIADDPNALSAAFENIHLAAEDVSYLRRSGGGNHVMQPDDNGPAVVTDNFASRAGGKPAQSGPQSEQLGSISSDLVAFQRKSGLRR